ncbi:hypothetical protein BH708_05900 [Brachybacterium sp. P6-10-X1]|uniref:Pr6Pr family membrane protein n=1 Tax=Brachybacterium sp. P6-10-X1 TaxID=1903186 RepID=UPI000971A533|nr:Pr6Pr family membrane protein [Brachybacterium sp. P6-10-X1]APX32331.1 hypothetical protein BH708_05900 [Brachybacterium sp. P6-10-X1]
MSAAARTVRVLVALAVLAALVHDVVVAARDGLLAQDISYFTNQSSLAFVLLVAGTLLLGRKRPPWLEDVRGAVTFYLAMTGIVYALLIAPPAELLRWDIGWTGIVLHRLAPVVAVADWLLTPRRRHAPARRILLWQLYPIAYLVLTWVRGAITGWYPYDFLDPTVSSWPQVLLVTAIVLVAFFTVASLLHLGGGRLRAEPSRREIPERTVA